MLALVFGQTHFQISREAAQQLADELWKGRISGSAISATKITEALALPTDRNQRVEFEEYEAPTVRAALQMLGILNGPH